MNVSTDLLGPAADEVTALFERIFRDLDRMRAGLEGLFTAGPVDSPAVVAAVEPHALAILDRGVVFGAGFVAGRETLADHELYLAWWQGDDRQLLGESDAPASGAPFDYTRREWFRVPQETGRAHVTGPYVDYVCTDEYVVTCTAPVLVGGRMVGVVGADVLVETLERLLLDTVSASGVTLVGDHGRTMVSADHRVAPGTLVDLATVRERAVCGDLPLTVVVP